MNEIARWIFAASVLLATGELAAQTFKCTNEAGGVTYSNTKCNELGLKDAGEVKDRVTVTPAYKPSAGATNLPRSPAPTAASNAPNIGTPAPAATPAEPDRRCFVVKTAKGYVSRCNDTPEE